jgi:hypothetical protein
LIAALAVRALADVMTSISDPAYSEEPAGGGAESIPDPAAPQFEEQPEHTDSRDQNEPVMDGALDDMSDGGTPKTEASDLMEDAGVDEVEVEQ